MVIIIWLITLDVATLYICNFVLFKNFLNSTLGICNTMFHHFLKSKVMKYGKKTFFRDSNTTIQLNALMFYFLKIIYLFSFIWGGGGVNSAKSLTRVLVIVVEMNIIFLEIWIQRFSKIHLHLSICLFAFQNAQCFDNAQLRNLIRQLIENWAWAVNLRWGTLPFRPACPKLTLLIVYSDKIIINEIS